jgi:hypothetical protein
MNDKLIFKNLPELFKQNSYFSARTTYNSDEGWFGCTEQHPTVFLRPINSRKIVILSIDPAYANRVHPDLAEDEAKKIKTTHNKSGIRYICYVNGNKIQYESYDGTLPTQRISTNFINSI